MKYLLQRTLPYAAAQLVTPTVKRIFINKVVHGVTNWHYDSVSLPSAKDGFGTITWTLCVHVGAKARVKLLVDDPGQPAAVFTVPLYSRDAYGFPGYRIKHKTAASVQPPGTRYSIVCFFMGHKKLDDVVAECFR